MEIWIDSSNRLMISTPEFPKDPSRDTDSFIFPINDSLGNNYNCIIFEKVAVVKGRRIFQAAVAFGPLGTDEKFYKDKPLYTEVLGGMIGQKFE